MFSAMKERKKWSYLRCWFACLTILYITVHADVCKFAKGGTKNLFAKSFQNIWNGLQSIFTQLRAEILLIPEILYLLSWGLYGTGIIWQSDCKMFISWTAQSVGRKKIFTICLTLFLCYFSFGKNTFFFKNVDWYIL